MDEVYRGWAGGRGVGGKPNAGKTIHQEANSSVVSSVGHRNYHSQSDFISSSLTLQAALLVPISGPIDPVVDCHGYAGSAKDRL